MRRPRCEFENPAGMKFCGQCATPLIGLCPQCGVANPPRLKFFVDCGASIGSASRLASPPTMAAQPQVPSRNTHAVPRGNMPHVEKGPARQTSAARRAVRRSHRGPQAVDRCQGGTAAPGLHPDAAIHAVHDDAEKESPVCGR
jgi:Double zinc ribbon